MPQFRLLHIARFTVPIEGKTLPDGRQAVGTEVVFSPLRDSSGQTFTLRYDEPEHALAWAKRHYPYLIHSLAVERVFNPDDYLCQNQ